METLAKLYEVKKDYQRAIDYYNLSDEIYYKYGNDPKCAELKYKIARIYLNATKHESEAIKFFEEALEILEDLKNSKESAEILHMLGDIYFNKGIIDLALFNLQKARDYYQDLQDEYHFNLLTEKINSLTNSNVTNF